MAVEARHLNLFPPPVEAYGHVYASQLAYVAPAKNTDNVFPVYGSVPVSRKRSRDTFLGEDISLQIHQQQVDIDRFISQHNENVRMEIEQRKRRMIACIQENVMKKLKAKESEIQEMGKLNWALEQRVKSLSVENQLWKDLAQSNEATVNALRSNLEQVLAQVENERQLNDVAAVEDDAQSCCGSSGYERRVDGTMCRSCGKEESSVLVLPCRHLCLCGFCGSSVHTCPVCFSVKTASVNVNLDS